MGKNYQVKRIIVKSGGYLSLQKHFKRAEHWVIVSGTPTVIVGKKKKKLAAKKSRLAGGVAGDEGRLERGAREVPLVGHVVDREDGLDGLEKRILIENRLQIGRDKPRLPIVAMDDIWLPAEPPQCLEHAAAEENEPFVVVLVIFSSHRALVDAVAAEVVGVVEEVDLDLFLQVHDEGGLDISRVYSVPDGNWNVLEPDDVVETKPPFADKSVPGHHNADLVPKVFDGFGQCARDVCKSAGLGKRLDLTRHKQNVQRFRHAE